MEKSLLLVSVYTIVTIASSAGLIYLGIRGRLESKSSNLSGPDYSIGSFVVGSVFGFHGALLAVYIVVRYLYGNSKDMGGVKTMLLLSHVGNGFIACIAGMVYVIKHGIHNCDDSDSRSEDCSFNKNIDTNYNIAVISLVLILLLFSLLYCAIPINNVDEDLWGIHGELRRMRRRNFRVEPTEDEDEFDNLRNQVQRLERRNRQLCDDVNMRGECMETFNVDIENMRHQLQRLERRNRQLCDDVNMRDERIETFNVDVENLRREVQRLERQNLQFCDNVYINMRDAHIETFNVDVENLRRQAQRVERCNRQLCDEVNSRDASDHAQDRAHGSQPTAQSSLPLLNQMHTHLMQIQRNQERQMRPMPSNPDVHRPSSSRIVPVTPLMHEHMDDEPPSYSEIYGRH